MGHAEVLGLGGQLGGVLGQEAEEVNRDLGGRETVTSTVVEKGAESSFRGLVKPNCQFWFVPLAYKET